MSYLNPLRAHHISNEDLAKLLKKQPSLFNFLSHMRKTALPLAIHERIMLSRLDSAQAQQQKPDLEKVQPSPLRSIRKKLQIRIKNEKDEQDLLAFKPFNLELVEDIPSLGWLLKLPENQRIQILESLSARDLASAWVAPKEVLKELEKSVPEKKLALLLSYAKAKPGSRNSRAYSMIHQNTLESLRNQTGKGDLTKSSLGENQNGAAA